MKLIVQGERIAATATDAYTGPEDFITAPDDFDASRLADYRYVNGVLAIGVPSSITSRQARLVLLQYGLLANVPVAIAALPSPQKEAAQIEWEYATTLERASPLIVGLADALGWPAETVDEMFRVGKAL